MTYAARSCGWILGLVALAGCGGDSAGVGGTESTTTTESSGGSSGSSANTTADTGSVSETGGGTSTADPSADSSGTDPSTTSEGGTSGGGLCTDEFPAIVTDIDETLTISDTEFLTQLADGNYDPIEREGAAELITAYADLGYRVVYLTARSETLGALNTGETARELTERWLLEHDFPIDPDTTMVVLAPNLVFGDSAQAFKAESLMTLQGEGWRFDNAYGNATSDIGAYALAGIPLDHTFIIGVEAGTGGTVAVDGEGWVDHTAAWLPGVPAVCEGS